MKVNALLSLLETLNKIKDEKIEKIKSNHIDKVKQ